MVMIKMLIPTPKFDELHKPQKYRFLPTGMGKNTEWLTLSSKLRTEVDSKFIYRKLQCYASYTTVIKC